MKNNIKSQLFFTTHSVFDDSKLEIIVRKLTRTISINYIQNKNQYTATEKSKKQKSKGFFILDFGESIEEAIERVKKTMDTENYKSDPSKQDYFKDNYAELHFIKNQCQKIPST